MTEDRAHRLAQLLKDIEDENVLFSELNKQHKATLERLHGEARTLGFAILSGQDELPLGKAGD